MDTQGMALGVLAALGRASQPSFSAQSGALLLSVLADGAGVVEMSGAEMACRLNCSRRTVRRILQELKAAGVLHLLRTGKGRAASRYYLYAVPVVRGSEADPCAK